MGYWGAAAASIVLLVAFSTGEAIACPRQDPRALERRLLKQAKEREQLEQQVRAAALAGRWLPLPVSFRVLKMYRVSGTVRVGPPAPAIQRRMRRRGTRRLIVSTLVCVNKDGTVRSLQQLRSSGYRTYDQQINRKLRSWRFRPYEIEQVPVPVCASVNFFYRPMHP